MLKHTQLTFKDKNSDWSSLNWDYAGSFLFIRREPILFID